MSATTATVTRYDEEQEQGPGLLGFFGGLLRWAFGILPLVTLTLVLVPTIWGLIAEGKWVLGVLLTFLGAVSWHLGWRWQVGLIDREILRRRVRGVLAAVGREPARIRTFSTGPGAYDVWIRSAHGQTVSDLISAMPAVADALQLVSWSRESSGARSGTLRVTLLTRDVMAEPIEAPAAPEQSLATEAPIGTGPSGQNICMSLMYQHLLAGGISGSGKSQFLLRLIDIALAAPDAQTWLIDPARVEFSGLKHRADRVALTVEDAISLLEDASAEMHRRLEIMESRGIKKWKPTDEDPAIVIVVDELAALTVDVDKNDQPAIKKPLAELARMARKTGISLVLATQTPDTSVIPSQIRNNMSLKVCFYVANSTQAETIVGEMVDSIDLDALSSDRPGMMWITGGKFRQPVVGRAYLVNE